MKIVCSACERISAAASFRTEGGRLWIACARCGAQSPLEVTGPRPGEATPASVPSLASPSRAVSELERPLQREAERPPAPSLTAVPSGPRKLPLQAVSDAVRLAAEAAQQQDPFDVPEDRCPKCIGPRPEEATTCPHCGLAYVNFRPEEVSPSPELASVFKRAMEQWDDSALQDAVLSFATQRGELPQAGRLYRIRLVAAPLDPVATRGRDEVLRRAAAASEVLLASSPRRDGELPAGWKVVAVGIVVAVSGIVLLLLWRIFSA